MAVAQSHKSATHTGSRTEDQGEPPRYPTKAASAFPREGEDRRDVPDVTGEPVRATGLQTNGPSQGECLGRACPWGCALSRDPHGLLNGRRRSC